MRCPVSQNAPVMQEWLWRGGRLRFAVTQGVVIGVFTGVFYWLGYPPPLAATARAVGAAAVGVISGALVAILEAARWSRRQLSALPPSDRIAALRAVRGGESVPDPRLAPGVLAYAEVVMGSVRRQQAWRPQWSRRWMLVGALGMVMLGAGDATDGHARWAVVLWAIAVMCVFAAWWLPGALEQRHARAQAAADFAAGQIDR